MNRSLLTRIEKLEAQQQMAEKRHVTINNDGSMIIHKKEKNFFYYPSATGKLFHADDSDVKVIMGPFGSGKSTICCAEVVQQACLMPKWKGERRSSRYAFVRNTAAELETTTLASWLEWFDELGEIKSRKKPLMIYEHEFNDGNGIIELEIIFIALDRPEDLKRVKSMNLTAVYFNEMSHMPHAALDFLKGRINRYPSNDMCSSYYSYIMGDYNPPNPRHWLYEEFEVKKTIGYKLFKQPSGLVLDEKGNAVKDENGEYIANKDADNYDVGLKKDYYIKMARGAGEEFIKVYCLGQYGLVKEGLPVYQEYNDDLHSSNEIDYNPDLPVDFGWDFGLTPACVLLQRDADGRVLVFKEFVTDRMGINHLVEDVVIPYLNKECPGWRQAISVGDPAGNAGQQTDETTCINAISERGIETFGAPSNQLVPRIEAVRGYLSRLSSGKPKFILSRKGCPHLREGFLGGYHYKKLRLLNEEKYRDEPEKNEFSHIHDALQYILLHITKMVYSGEEDDIIAKIYNPEKPFFHGAILRRK